MAQAELIRALCRGALPWGHSEAARGPLRHPHAQGPSQACWLLCLGAGPEKGAEQSLTKPALL